jgi:hypothetical protein
MTKDNANDEIEEHLDRTAARVTPVGSQFLFRM